MPITYSGLISIEDHVLPALREAGFTVKASCSNLYIEPYTSISLRQGRTVLLRGPAAESAARTLLEKCRPYGEEIAVEVTRGKANICPGGMFHAWKPARWNFFTSKVVCVQCGAVDYHDFENF